MATAWKAATARTPFPEAPAATGFTAVTATTASRAATATTGSSATPATIRSPAIRATTNSTAATRDDHLNGGTGADGLYGGNGQDTLVSLDAAATDSLFGDADYDTFWTDLDDSIVNAAATEVRESVHRIAGFENGADCTLNGEDIEDPIDGTNYKNFADRPLFASTGPSENDIDQGGLGDCGLMAAMGSVAMASPNAVYQTVVDLGDGTYAVRLGGDHYFRVDADLPTLNASSSTPIYAGLGVEDSLWVAIVEKAYTHYRTGADTYASIEGENPEAALIALNAANTEDDWFSTYASTQALLDDIAAKLDAGLAVECGFVEDGVPPGVPVIDNHAYTVLGVNRDASGKVVSVILRNPHGPAGADAFVTLTGDELFACSAYVAWGEVV